MVHWFFSSDRHHLPWHMKNAALHVLFEQGLLGLALLGSAVALVLARLSFGRGRDHPLAPAIVAALIGFATVGAFDSLLDAPRIGFIFFTLLLLGLGLRALPGEGVARVA
jgi:tellurite resistance protein TehA-like permease